MTEDRTNYDMTSSLYCGSSDDGCRHLLARRVRCWRRFSNGGRGGGGGQRSRWSLRERRHGFSHRGLHRGFNRGDSHRGLSSNFFQRLRRRRLISSLVSTPEIFSISTANFSVDSDIMRIRVQLLPDTHLVSRSRGDRTQTISLGDLFARLPPRALLAASPPARDLCWLLFLRGFSSKRETARSIGSSKHISIQP